MLVVSRESGERVLVGEDIELVVLKVDGGRVRLGFTNARYMPICRAEVHRAPVDAESRDDSARFNPRQVA